MCTVTLTNIASEKGFILTSSRDEAPQRETIAPQIYLEEGVKMLFPKDVMAGGTWLGVSEKKRLICLLNGEFEKHDRNPPYRLSRGVVVKHLLASDGFEKAIADYDLLQVEPFTIIAVEWQESLKFFEFVWDGLKKHFRNLAMGSHIWSSSPLYSEEMKELRREWFQKFHDSNPLTSENLLEFHHSAGVGDPEIDVRMNRGFVRTQSISQVELSEEKILFSYKDLSTGEVSRNEF
ncbi:Transport and Golgi organisation 2 [Salinimicrobium catena]|uniref:Transport and Golgi organisation 2 n=1 Tax=Salinimicrobium catena TaxID=390640 RepID=A0A1H5PC45_9FLAO|nr:NRDE family protein [Salinimicrobium catena]SDL78761.1 Transport and Golgi organisation 2 [Salinimicrobium catena]SEF11503.1 Transport and Golgi organisation 2 [Salinimicrobium catena]